MSVSKRAAISAEAAAGRGRATTRERLIESARTLFAERGLRGVTTHDIARDAGFASGTFYLHFPDKRALFRELVAESIAALRDRLTKSAAGASSVADAVRSHATAMIAFAEEQRDLVRILFSADVDAAVVSADALDDLAAAIAAGRRERRSPGAEGSDLDVTVLSQALVGMWARVVAWWVADPARASRDAVIETLTRIQLEGTHPSPRL